MIHYSLAFNQYYQHMVEVQVRFTAQPQQTIWLPTWIPGSYLIREFARHIEALTAVDCSTQQPLAMRKISKNQWQLEHQQAVELEVRYQVYAYDLSVRGAYVDDERLYVNPAAVCISVSGQEHVPLILNLHIPAPLQHFTLATSLQLLKAGADSYQLYASNYHQLIDRPFELAELATRQFTAGGIPHRIAISGRHHADLDRLAADLAQICTAHLALFGQAPFSDYLFMVMATSNSYGGLEHECCTSLMTPRDDLPPYCPPPPATPSGPAHLAGQQQSPQSPQQTTTQRPKTDPITQTAGNMPVQPAAPGPAYQRFLGLCSHEYFHAWLVKFIRPHNHVKPNLQQEEYTPLLWLFEGVTSYYDDLMLYRSGVINQQAYLDLLKEQINRYLSNPGRLIQSVAESSFDAWIKLYRPDENSNNASTSYYNKGALVALCMDLTLRQQSSSLDQLLGQLYQRARQGIQVDDNSLPQLCQQLTGQCWQGFFEQFVNGVAELPLQALLGQFGVEVQWQTTRWPWGLKVQDSPQGVVVQQVLRDSAAACAGISAQDVIIAINGFKATAHRLEQLASHCVASAAPLMPAAGQHSGVGQVQGQNPDTDPHLHIDQEADQYTDQETNQHTDQETPQGPRQNQDPHLVPHQDSMTLECLAFRRDELKRLYVPNQSVNLGSVQLLVADPERIAQWLDALI